MSNYSIQEALRSLRQEETSVKVLKEYKEETTPEQKAMRKRYPSKPNPTLYDLFDQVYCCITDSGDNDTKNALGNLHNYVEANPYKIFSNAFVKPGFDVLSIQLDTEEEKANETERKAKEIADKFGLESEVIKNSGSKFFSIYVPEDAPINYDVLVDSTDKNGTSIKDLVKTSRKKFGKNFISADPDKAKVKEDVQSSMPVQVLPVNEVKDFILNIPEATPTRPPKFFKLGYIKELTKEIAAKYRGGRGSEGQPFVRIFKCTEYSSLYTGADWRSTNATQAADKALGTERHTGERTGFNFSSDDATVNRIGTYRDGSEALQAYISDNSQQKTKFFISFNDEDLREIPRAEVAEYLQPGFAAKVINPTHAAAGVDAEGNQVFDKPVNRFKLTGIYMIGNLGHSIM